jgi:hypothetical protein
MALFCGYRIQDEFFDAKKMMIFSKNKTKDMDELSLLKPLRFFSFRFSLFKV